MAVFFSVPVFAAPVRVLISENKRSADVRVKGGYTVKALPSLALVKKGEDLKGSLSADAKGIWFDKKVWPVKGLRIEPLGEFHDLVRLDRDAAEAVNVAFDIVLEVAIGDRARKRHCGVR